MNKFPEMISSVVQLEDILSRPSEATVESVKAYNGDIMILGAGGKVGPTMALTAKRAMDAANVKKQVIAVDVMPMPSLEKQGIKTIVCNMLDLDAVKSLPKIENIIYMAGRKFGSTGTEWITWAVNVMVPHNVAQVFTESKIAVFSTGCVYPVMPLGSGGSVETDKADPVGEYAQSCLGRERMFDYYAAEKGERVVQIRLNYAVELRYGVLVDVATKVYNGEPVDLTTGYINGIWQGDVCNQTIQSLEYASSPSSILNITGPETVSVRWAASEFGRLFGKTPVFAGTENGRGYLNNAAKANSLFGNPAVPVGTMIRWIAHWIKNGGENIGKPTHFETQDGKY
jgi:dTDP-4-dehydrorhamnose reductase